MGDGVGFARTGGSVCLVGLADGPASIDPAEWLRKEITVTTALAYVHDEFATAMQLLADGKVRVDRAAHLDDEPRRPRGRCSTTWRAGTRRR